MARGVFAPADIGGTLEALCRGQAEGRRDSAERTVFKSVGSALEDLAAAILVADGMARTRPAV
jgi:ornithine cyclodeaminase